MVARAASRSPSASYPWHLPRGTRMNTGSTSHTSSPPRLPWRTKLHALCPSRRARSKKSQSSRVHIGARLTPKFMRNASVTRTDTVHMRPRTSDSTAGRGLDPLREWGSMAERTTTVVPPTWSHAPGFGIAAHVPFGLPGGRSHAGGGEHPRRRRPARSPLRVPSCRYPPELSNRRRSGGASPMDALKRRKTWKMLVIASRG